MAGARRPQGMAPGARLVARSVRRRRARLDSGGAGGMGGAMAPPMIPPESASDFLSRHGWSDAEILPLAGGARFPRYFRILAGERRAVLMDAPPPQEDVRPFVAVAGWLEQIGLVAPKVLGADIARGLP